MAHAQPHTSTITATVPAVFTHDLEVRDQDMRGLYEKAKRDQWNASRDINWSQEIDPDRGILPDGLIDIYGTKYWERLSVAQRNELNRHFSAWRISQLMYEPVGQHPAEHRCQVLHVHAGRRRSPSLRGADALPV